MARKPTVKEEITIPDITQGIVDVCIIGTSPMIMHSMSAKAMQTLLLPEATGRKTKAERAQALKHEPLEEFRRSVYRARDGETALSFPAPAFKTAIMTAAGRMSGATKTEIGQLTWIEGYHAPIWGIPQIFMSVVRSADMNKTPDVRTRAILPEWATRIQIRFVKPNLTAQVVISLLSAAGIVAGIGDFRQEKGKGSFGQWRLTMPDDPEFKRIVAKQGRKEQEKALADPVCYDPETEELLSWYRETVKSVGKERAA